MLGVRVYLWDNCIRKNNSLRFSGCNPIDVIILNGGNYSEPVDETQLSVQASMQQVTGPVLNSE